MPSSNELRILDLIHEKPTGSQRDFASASGFSLGLTNAILKRLGKTGYIKIQSLNSRKMKYILTSKGFSEKTKRSIDYITNTIKSFHTCLTRVKAVLKKEIANGKRHFIVVGEGNLAELTELAIKELNADITFEKQFHGSRTTKPGTVVLDCRFGAIEDGRIGVSMLSRLLEGEAPFPEPAIAQKPKS